MSAAFYLGVDVSKNSLAVTLIDQRDKILWSNKSIANTTVGFEKLAEQVLKHASKKSNGQSFIVYLGMESTGVYGEQLAYFFHDHNSEGRFALYVLNPMAVRAYAKASMELNKNDATDARVIASYLSVAVAKEQVRPWVAPSEEERRLRALSRRRGELVALLIAEKNRLEKLENMALPSEEVVRSVKEHIQYLQDAITALDTDISDHISRYPKLSENDELLQSIAGIGKVTSATLLGEVGDLSQFSTVKQFTSFTGLAPMEFSSGSSVWKRSKISRRGNARIRQCLYMAVMIAVRINPVLRRFYEHLLEQGKCKKVALVACMRKMLHLIWGVLKNRSLFDPQHAV